MSAIVAADVPDILAAAGLNVGIVPDFLTNGHGRMVSVDGHLVHHTADDGGLWSVYEWPGRWDDVRPDVPSPRCNVWWPESTFDGKDVWCVSAGMAYHAGAGSTLALGEVRAGKMHAGVADAAARGLLDDGAAGSAVLLGHEVQNTGLAGDVYEQADRVLWGIAALNNAAGLTAGHVSLHRKYTRRKPDWSYPDSRDMWSQIHAYQLGDTMPTLDEIGELLDRKFPDLSVPAGGEPSPYLTERIAKRTMTRIRDTAGLATSAQASSIANRVAAVQTLVGEHTDDRAVILAAIAADPTTATLSAEQFAELKAAFPQVDQAALEAAVRAVLQDVELTVGQP